MDGDRSDVWDNPSLVDGGANICLTGILGLLVDMVSIAPLPREISLDVCCTKRGLLPLTLVDGLVPCPPPMKRWHKDLSLVPPNHLTESELWMLRLGSLGEDQLDLLPVRVTGILPCFQYHPF